jgi:excisionase family DNA binding protein
MVSSTHSIEILADLNRENPAASTSKTEGLLTVRDVAELLRVPVSWVYDRTRKRLLDRLPGIRLGKYWRFRQGEVIAWVEAQREHSHES